MGVAPQPGEPAAASDEPSGDAEPPVSGDGATSAPGGDTAPTDGSSADTATAAPEGSAQGDAPAAGDTPAGQPKPSSPDTNPDTAPKAETITVRPQSSTDATAGKPVAASATPTPEAVVDARRRNADDRLLFRASLLSFGVATVAMVPMIVGFRQAAAARAVLEDEDHASPEVRAQNTDLRRSMLRLGVGAGVLAGVYAVTGAVLLGVDRRRRRARATAVAPAVGPGHAGVVFRARF